MNWLTVMIISLTFSTIYVHFSTYQWLAVLYMIPTGIVIGLWKMEIVELEQKPFIWRVTFTNDSHS